MSIPQAILDAFSLLARGDAALLEIIRVTLKTSFVALAIAAPCAIAASYLIAQHAFPGRRIAIWLAQAAMALPTVLIGLLLYLALSRHGPLGPLHWLFSQPGIIAGQVMIAIPVLVAFSLTAIQAADPRLAETAITLGASRLGVMRTILHEVRFGIMAAVISGFGRVIAEVGCALMVGGNIEGETRTITTAIALQTSKGEFAQGIALGMVLVTIALAVNALLAWLQGDTHAARGVS